MKLNMKKKQRRTVTALRPLHEALALGALFAVLRNERQGSGIDVRATLRGRALVRGGTDGLLAMAAQADTGSARAGAERHHGHTVHAVSFELHLLLDEESATLRRAREVLLLFLLAGVLLQESEEEVLADDVALRQEAEGVRQDSSGGELSAVVRGVHPALRTESRKLSRVHHRLQRAAYAFLAVAV